MKTCKLNINISKFRYFVLFLFIFLKVSNTLSAQEDPKISINGISYGSISINDLVNQEKIICKDKNIKIYGFTMSYPIGEDDFVELISPSDSLTKEMKDNIKNLKPGTEVSFENIKAKKADKTIILEAITLKIRE